MLYRYQKHLQFSYGAFVTGTLSDIGLLKQFCFFWNMGAILYISNSQKLLMDTRKSPFQSDSGTLLLLKFSHHASVLSFLTQHNLCDFLFIKNLSFIFLGLNNVRFLWF